MRSKTFLIFILLLTLNIVFISAECNETQIDINTASAEELTEIIYVGDVTAGYIISGRPFASLEGLLNVSGIGEFKLTAIKSQGLACVNTSFIPDDSNEDNNETPNDSEEEEKFDNEEPIVIRVVSHNINESKPIKLETEVIELNANTKDIKTENNKENLSKTRNYLLLGFFTFTMLIIALLLIKTLNTNKRKNEFR